jgi:hypothetical protein
MSNINNIFCNNIEDNKNININNNKNKENPLEKDIGNKHLELKKNNSINKNLKDSSKKNEAQKNHNKSINNNNSLALSSIGNYLSDNRNNNENESQVRAHLPLSKKISEKSQTNIPGNNNIQNEKTLFSPQACRTSVGFSLKKLSIKLNNTPKENLKVSKKIFENKNRQSKKPIYSKTITNNATNSTTNNLINDSNHNSYSNSNISNNKIKVNNKKKVTDKPLKKQNTNELYNTIPNKINKKANEKQEKSDIFISKSINLLNKPLKLNKKNENNNVNLNLNNSVNTNKNLKIINSKKIGKDSISRNINFKNNITDSSIINNKNGLYISNKLQDSENNYLEDYDFSIPKQYLNKEYKLIKSLKTDDKIINLYTNDKKEIIFKSGVKKEIYEDGHQIIYFVNGDLKQIYPNGISCYFFQESKTVQTTLSNGTEIYKFENGQIEKHFPDGNKQILFNDGTERVIYNDGTEENIY